MNELNFRREDVAASQPLPVNGGDDAGRNGRFRVAPLLTQYLNIARRRKWLILGAIATALALGLVLTLMMTPQYTSRSTVEIQRENYNIVRVQGVEPETSSVDLEFYQTQYGILESDALAQRVATNLRLFDDPSFFAMMGSRLATEWFQDGRPITSASTRERRIQAAGQILSRRVSIAPVRLSRLVHVSFTSPDPAFSQRVVEAWNRNFIESTLERRFEATSYARRFLEERLAQLRTRLDESERRLVAYATREGIVNLPASSPAAGEGGITGERSIIADDLTALNRARSQAVADRVLAQSRLRAGQGAVSEGLANPAINGLRERRAELNAEYSRMLVQFEPAYPPALAMREQIRSLDTAIAREEGRVRDTLRGDFAASQERERQLSSGVETLKSGLLDLRRRSIQYNIFQRDVDTNRQLYDALLQRYKEIGVAGGVGINNIAVVDPAQVPQVPSSPKLLINLLLAMIFGLAIGSGLALVLEQIDDAIGDPSELQSALNLPMLGIVPNQKDGEPLDALEDRKSDISEAYLTVQSSLAFSTDHGIPRNFLVTSGQPGEGKTTTAYALARVLARTGRKVLFVDGDMRSPSVHHLLNVNNERGLSSFLAGDDDLDGMVQWRKDLNLAVLAAGPQPPSAAELLSGSRVELLLDRLAQQFDHVIVDAPPVMGLADAPLLGSRMEGVIFVVRAHSSRTSAARVALARLTAAQARIFGAVLTRFEAKRAYYGYGYDYGYGYGYRKTAEAGS
jgi:polysaccharide biosynthesis transport protein